MHYKCNGILKPTATENEFFVILTQNARSRPLSMNWRENSPLAIPRDLRTRLTLKEPLKHLTRLPPGVKRHQ